MSHCVCETMSNYLDFFLSVGDKICHSPLKKVKRQHNLLLSVFQYSHLFEGLSNDSS